MRQVVRICFARPPFRKPYDEFVLFIFLSVVYVLRSDALLCCGPLCATHCNVISASASEQRAHQHTLGKTATAPAQQHHRATSSSTPSTQNTVNTENTVTLNRAGSSYVSPVIVSVCLVEGGLSYEAGCGHIAHKHTFFPLLFVVVFYCCCCCCCCCSRGFHLHCGMPHDYRSCTSASPSVRPPCLCLACAFNFRWGSSSEQQLCEHRIN